MLSLRKFIGTWDLPVDRSRFGQLERDEKSGQPQSCKSVACREKAPGINETSGDNLPKNNGAPDRGTQARNLGAAGSRKAPAGLEKKSICKTNPLPQHAREVLGRMISGQMNRGLPKSLPLCLTAQPERDD